MGKIEAMDYPARENYALVSSGDADEDARRLDAFLRREKRLIEGVCANGCGPMVDVASTHEEAAHRECPKCGFGYFQSPSHKEKRNEYSRHA